MAATSFGDGIWGINDDETGIILESISFNYTNEKKGIKNRIGETTGITYYDEKVEISLKGSIASGTPFSGTLAASLVLQNDIPDQLKETVTGGSLLIEEISIEHGAEDYQSIEVKAVYYPFI